MRKILVVFITLVLFPIPYLLGRIANNYYPHPALLTDHRLFTQIGGMYFYGLIVVMILFLLVLIFCGLREFVNNLLKAKSKSKR